MTVTTNHYVLSNRNELIKSYGFAEEIASNENFLKEALALAQKITGCKIAYISLLDEEKQYILSQNNATLSTIDAKDSVCQFTVMEDSFFEIENTNIDIRSKDLSVIKKNNISYYGGFPLTNDENYNIGALCVMDHHPKKLNNLQIEILSLISQQVVNKLDNQRSMIQLIKEINSNFKPAACADLNCLRGELGHLQTEVVNQNQVITNQKKELEKINSELSNFAHVVAHDVKAPLRTIKSFSQMIERKLGSCNDDSIGEYFNYIKSAVDNLNDLINDLLSFSEIDRKGEQNFVPLSLHVILENVLINLADNITSTNTQIELPKEDITIYGHKSHLISLFQNLISNGIKYQNDNSTPIIKIDAITQEDACLISVRDNGIGISEEYFEKIFKPFKRLHDKQKYQGSGIGLATCKKILNQMNSDLEVESEVNKGSVFSFQLPIKN